MSEIGPDTVGKNRQYRFFSHNRQILKRFFQCDIVQRIITDVEFVAENTAKYVKTYNYEALGQMKVSFCCLWPVWVSQ